MRQRHTFTFFVLAIVIELFMNSCCGSIASGVECHPEDYFHFNIYSMTGENLFMGTNPKYDLEELKLYTIRDGVRYDAKGIYPVGTEYFTAPLDYKFEKLIVEIKNQPKDTIDLKFNVTDNKCCGSETEIDVVTVDGKEIEYQYYDGIEIKLED